MPSGRPVPLGLRQTSEIKTVSFENVTGALEKKGVHKGKIKTNDIFPENTDSSRSRAVPTTSSEGDRLFVAVPPRVAGRAAGIPTT